MSNIAKTLVPHESGYGIYPAVVTDRIVAAAGTDNQEHTGEWVSVTGLNTESLTAHGTEGEQLFALELMVTCRTTLADTQDLKLKALKIETAPPDGSGDPDSGSLVLIPAVSLAVDIVELGVTPKTDQEVGVTASVQDDITVKTASGAETNVLTVVRLSFGVRPPIGLNFFRVKFTADLSAGSLDTADISAVIRSRALSVPPCAAASRNPRIAFKRAPSRSLSTWKKLRRARSVK